MRLKEKIVCFAALFFVFVTQVCAGAAVDSIVFVGNLRTQENFLARIVAPVINTEYSADTDSVIFRKLERTGLFNQIIIQPSLRAEDDNVVIFVILNERPAFQPIGVGAGLFGSLYGEDKTWPWLCMQFRYNNLFGVGQRLYFDFGLFQNRYFATTWHVPVGGSDYFFDAGGLIERRPSLIFEWEISPLLNTFLRFGRMISDNQKVSYEIAPRFRRYNSVVRDAGGSWRRDSVIDNFWEVYQRLQYQIRFSDDFYPPLFSTFAQVSLNTNAMLAFQDKVFFGVSGELSQNIPVWQMARHSFLLRMRFDLTPVGERSVYGGFLTGGAAFVRGFDDDIIGSKHATIFGNRIVSTAEYQFHIVTLPEMRFRFLSFVSQSMAGFRPEIAGAVFLDAGYLFEDFYEPKGASVNAASMGVSLRFLQPHMRLGGAIDFAWQLRASSQYLKSNRGAPVLHIGFVQHF